VLGINETDYVVRLTTSTAASLQCYSIQLSTVTSTGTTSWGAIKALHR